MATARRHALLTPVLLLLVALTVLLVEAKAWPNTTPQAQIGEQAGEQAVATASPVVSDTASVSPATQAAAKKAWPNTTPQAQRLLGQIGEEAGEQAVATGSPVASDTASASPATQAAAKKAWPNTTPRALQPRCSGTAPRAQRPVGQSGKKARQQAFATARPLAGDASSGSQATKAEAKKQAWPNTTPRALQPRRSSTAPRAQRGVGQSGKKAGKQAVATARPLAGDASSGSPATKAEAKKQAWPNTTPRALQPRRSSTAPRAQRRLWQIGEEAGEQALATASPLPGEAPSGSPPTPAAAKEVPTNYELHYDQQASPNTTPRALQPWRSSTAPRAQRPVGQTGMKAGEQVVTTARPLAGDASSGSPATQAAAKKRGGRQLVVHLQEGVIRGKPRKTVYGSPYVSFSGIPYAEPPVGPLRYKSPVPIAGWTGEHDARVEGPPCPQLNDKGKYVGSEDCLYLNVYVPKLQKSKVGMNSRLQKVMVWIHGGSFVQGNGGRAQFGPDFLIERGVILVTFNYRLSVLGFLSMESESAPGNYGLKDQNLALHWVKRNIRAFGGDPDDVTVFGEGAGAASVHFHLLSNSSRGLFSRGIAAGASALSPWAFCRTPRQRARSLAAALGLPGSASDQQALFLLSSVPPWLLLEHAGAALSPRDSASLHTSAFVPSVEPVHSGAFLTESPTSLMRKGNVLHVPLIAGVNSKEGNFFLSAAADGKLSTTESLENFNSNFVSIIGPDIRDKLEANEDIIAEMAADFYYGKSEITREKDLNTTNLLSDLYFEEPVDSAVRIIAKVSRQPVRYYRFSFKGPNSAVQDQPGVGHGEDLKYLFLTSLSKQNLNRSSDEGIARDRMVDMWTNFAKFGDPTPTATPLLKTTWKPYTRPTRHFLDIGAELTLDSSLDDRRMQFWHEALPPLRGTKSLY